MIRLIIAGSVLALILLITLIVLMRKRRAKAATLNAPKAAEKTPQAAIKVVVKTSTETEAVEPPTPPAPVPEPIATVITEPTPPPVTVSVAASTKAAPRAAKVIVYEHKQPHVPQDAQLRRHYVTQLRAIIEALNPPCPTDSALRRHYDALLASQLADCLDDAEAAERLLGQYQQHKKTLLATPTASVVAPTAPVATTAASAPVAAPAPAPNSDIVTLPQDSALRRHAITQLYAELTEGKPRPSDSALRRHYDAMINAELEQRLGAQAL
ncbi:MAG: hypothetical protein HOP34_11575 [Methylococcaceae bacterium]|nr:hypothetical protein [Methylococcaceae bacterium]